MRTTFRRHTKMSSKKSKTKTATVKLTPKQASIASVSLLRGLDNAIEKSRRGTAELESLKSRVGTLSAGLSNLALAPSVKPAEKARAQAKPATKAKPTPGTALGAAPAQAKAPKAKAPKAKPAQAKPAMKAKPAKVKAPKAKTAPKAAPAAKEAPAKAESKPSPAPAAHKEPVSGRPSARAASKEVLAANGGKMKSRDLREAVCAKYGQYSNQTFYEIFKHDPELSLVDNVVSFVPATKAEPDLELVRRVEADRSTASVV